jgi:hypothetical protein
MQTTETWIQYLVEKHFPVVPIYVIESSFYEDKSKELRELIMSKGNKTGSVSFDDWLVPLISQTLKIPGTKLEMIPMKVLKECFQKKTYEKIAKTRADDGVKEMDDAEWNVIHLEQRSCRRDWWYTIN